MQYNPFIADKGLEFGVMPDGPTDHEGHCVGFWKKMRRADGVLGAGCDRIYVIRLRLRLALAVKV